MSHETDAEAVAAQRAAMARIFKARRESRKVGHLIGKLMTAEKAMMDAVHELRGCEAFVPEATSEEGVQTTDHLQRIVRKLNEAGLMTTTLRMLIEDRR